MIKTSYLTFFFLIPLTCWDLVSQRQMLFSRGLQRRSLLCYSRQRFPIIAHSLELFPGTEEVYMICAVSEQQHVVLRNGTGMGDRIITGRRGSGVTSRGWATCLLVTVGLSGEHWRPLRARCLRRRRLWFDRRAGRHLCADSVVRARWGWRRGEGKVVNGWRRVRLTQQNALCNIDICPVRLRHHGGSSRLVERRARGLLLWVTEAIGERERWRHRTSCRWIELSAGGFISKASRFSTHWQICPRSTGRRARLIGPDASLCFFSCESSQWFQQIFHRVSRRDARLVMGVRTAQAVGLSEGFRQRLMMLGQITVRVRTPQFVVPLLAAEEKETVMK